MEYNITPVSAPRLTRRDKWLTPRRPCVQKYFDFRGAVNRLGVKVPESGAHIIFIMPMADSWGQKKKILWDGKAHQGKNDVDNLLKALLDAVFDDDRHIWDIRVTKLWGYEGKIIINEHP